MAKVFIDGEAGTTGLQIRDRLNGMDGIEAISIDPNLRKDDAARRDMMREADVVILCLPDEAARDAVTLADSLGDDAPRIIDASGGRYGGRGQAQAGFILGIIGSVLWVLGVIIWIIGFGAAMTTNTGGY